LPVQAQFSGNQRQLGFTLVEMLVGVVVLGLVLGAASSGLHRYIRAQQVDRAADAVLWEITVARSYAIRQGHPISLVMDESARSLTVRDGNGVWRTMQFGANSDLPVDALTLDLPGDSLVFSFRGFCLNCSGVSNATITVSVGSRQRKIQVGFLGRAERLRS
jgi:type II secretion system protein H